MPAEKWQLKNASEKTVQPSEKPEGCILTDRVI